MEYCNFLQFSSRKERFGRIMRDFDEMRNIDVDYEPRVIYKKSGGFLGKFVALLLGIIIGIAAGLGGLVGAGWYLYKKMPIEQGFDTANRFLPEGMDKIDYTQYIDGSYGQKTIEALVGDVMNAAKEIADGTGTLNTLNAISPYVRTLIAGDGSEESKGLVDMLAEYSIVVDADELMSKIIVKPESETETKPDVYLMDYLMDCVYDTPMGDLFNLLDVQLNDVLLSICYGVEGVDWEWVDQATGEVRMLNGAEKLTLGGFMGEDLSATIQSLPIDTLMHIDLTDKIMSVLAYGSAHRYTVDDGKAVMNQVFYTYEANGNKYTLYDDMGDLYLKDITIPDLGNPYMHTFTQGEETVTEYYKYYDDGTTKRFYAYSDAACTKPILFKKTTVGDLNGNAMELVDGLYLKDLLPINLEDTTILSLAYGRYGLDWEFDNTVEGGIKMLNGAEPRTIKQLREKGNELINEIYLSDVIHTDHDNVLIMYILYGHEGLHYKITGDKVEMLPEQVAVVDGENIVWNEYGDVKLSTALASDGTFTMETNNKTYKLGNPVGGTLITEEGKEATLYYITDENGQQVIFDHTHLGDLKGNAPLFTKMTARLTLTDVLGETAITGNSIFKHLASTYIKDIPNAVENLTIGQMFESELASNKVLYALKDATLKTLSGEISSLTIGQIFADNLDNKVLNALSPYSLNDLPSVIPTLQIKQLVDVEGNNLLELLGDATLDTLPQKVNTLTIQDVLKDEIYEADGTTMKAIWKYMLATGETDFKAYYLVASGTNKGFGDLMTNMTNNLQTAPLVQLVEDDLITFTDDSTSGGKTAAQKKEDFTDPDQYTYLPGKAAILGDKALQEMTIVELLDYIIYELPNLSISA